MTLSDNPKLKLAVIMSGGVNSDGTLPAHVASRVNMFLNKCHSYEAVIFSSRYTLNRPQRLSAQGFVISEAEAMYVFCSQAGLSTPAFIENFSTDTIGSGLFCADMVKNLGLKPDVVDVFTSDFHSKRSLEVFKWSFGLIEGFNMDIRVFASKTVPRPTERIDKEYQSLLSFIENWSIISDWETAWQKLLTEHNNYSTQPRDFYISSSELLY